MPDSSESYHSEGAQYMGESGALSSKQRPMVESIPVLDAADTVTVQIELLREQYEAILGVVQAQEWEPEDGLRTVLLSGLGYLDASLQVERINSVATQGELETARRLDALVQDLASYRSMYAVMKYKAFKLYKTGRTLEFNVAGLRATERMWDEWADRMRRERADLQAEVLRLRSVVAEFRVEGLGPATGSGERVGLDLSSLIPTLQHPPPPLASDDWLKKPTPAQADQPGPLPLLPDATDEATGSEPRPSFWARLFRRKS